MRVRLAAIGATSGLPFAFGAASVIYGLVLGSLVPTELLNPGLADPVNLILTAMLYVAPPAAGIAALHVRQLRRSGLFDLAEASTRGVRGPAVLAFVSLAVWQVAAVLALGGVLLARSDLSGAVTAPMVLAAVQPPLVAVAATAVGVQVGARVRGRMAPALTAIGAFVLLYALALSGDPLHRLSPVLSEVYYPTYLEPSPRRVAAVIVLLVGVAGAALAFLPGRSATGTRAIVPALALATATAGLVGSALVGDETARVRVAGEVVCATEGSTELCVWSESEELLRPNLRKLVDVRAAIAGSFPTPDRFAEPGADPDARPVQVAQVPGLDSWLPAALAVVPVADCSNADARRASDALVQWVQRAAAAGGSGDPSSGEVSAVLERPEDDQRAWAGEQFDAASEGCRFVAY
ncbi:hypothetical protein QE364_000116 [Nocardioides zeae]|uniref:Uncharacterized protein n=1 Tax=Nocardioides zeae TaxID=1457234 RepID=A0ACC6ICI0_9ACTN|nr:hypothetical protein [Nocardioides zeae]MDR6175497.1 hypothetical protein [Nocardioides zeae]MDR6208428.1 hypothetical protein [Nocardioides zeae]